MAFVSPGKAAPSDQGERDSEYEETCRCAHGADDASKSLAPPLAFDVGLPLQVRGDRFLTDFAIPSFYFHLVSAYGILRSHGVPLKKGDFLGV